MMEMKRKDEELKMNSKKRIHYLDIAKGISMIAIIAGHMGNGAINQFVFTFHVPIFFLISGYFMNAAEDDGAFIKKKARQLLLPYAITSVCIILGAAISSWITDHNASQVLSTVKYWFLAAIYGSGTFEYNGAFHIGIIGAIWFLLALFFSLILVKYFIRQQYAFMLVLICSYIGFKTRDMFWLPLSVQAGLFSSVFVYCGYKMKEMKLLERSESSPLTVGAALLWFVCILFCGRFYVVTNYCENGILDVLGALAGSYIVILLCRRMERAFPDLSKIFIFLGENSLVLLCAHIFDLDVLSLYWNSIQAFLTDQLHLGTVGFFSTLVLLKLFLYSCVVLLVNSLRGGHCRRLYQYLDHAAVPYQTREGNGRQSKVLGHCKGHSHHFGDLGAYGLPGLFENDHFLFPHAILLYCKWIFYKKLSDSKYIQKICKKLIDAVHAGMYDLGVCLSLYLGPGGLQSCVFLQSKSNDRRHEQNINAFYKL